jgi:hypothetical protein
LKKYATVMALVLVVYGCGGGEQRIAALEQRVSVAEAKIKKLEASAVPAATTAAQEPGSATAAATCINYTTAAIVRSREHSGNIRDGHEPQVADSKRQRVDGVKASNPVCATNSQQTT